MAKKMAGGKWLGTRASSSATVMRIFDTEKEAVEWENESKEQVRDDK